MSFILKIKEKGLPRFLLKLVLFLSIIFLLDFSVGSILKYFYYTQDSGLLFRTTYVIDRTRAEMLIFGSSTANHHYYPNAFEKRMNISFYNAGKDGYSVSYHYSVLKSVLKRYSPKIAILDFNIGELNKKSHDRISSLLPYYSNHPKIRSIIQLKSPYEKYKLLSKTYPFNSIIFTIAIGNLDYNRTRKNTYDEEGYIPINRVWNKPLSTDTSTVKQELDPYKINIFKSFIKDCVNSNVKLYIVISPLFMRYSSENSSIAIAQQISNEFKIPFYNFSNDTTFLNHPELFADVVHLNDSGAKVYSNKVIDKIIQKQP